MTSDHKEPIDYFTKVVTSGNNELYCDLPPQQIITVTSDQEEPIDYFTNVVTSGNNELCCHLSAKDDLKKY